MIPHIITEEQKEIAEYFWEVSWTELSAEDVQYALDWYYYHEWAEIHYG